MLLGSDYHRQLLGHSDHAELGLKDCAFVALFVKQYSMRFLEKITGAATPTTPTTDPAVGAGVDAGPTPAGHPAHADAVLVDHEPAPPAEPHIDDHKPNPKVAVAVAGAAVSVTITFPSLCLAMDKASWYRDRA